MIRIELAGEPRGKGRPRFSRKNGAVFTPKPTATYEAQLKYAAQMVMGQRSPLEGALLVRVHAVFSVPASWSVRKKAQAIGGEIRPTKKPDIDNIAKMLDALNQVVWRDDSQIVNAELRKVYSDRPRLVIEVEALP